jgi:hypothetical protein
MTWGRAIMFKRWKWRPSLRNLILNQGKQIMAISAEVQAILDQARSLTSVVASVDAGMKALTAQVQQLQADIKSTPSLSADDKTALLEATDDLTASIATLNADIPANTPAARRRAAS